MKKVSTATALFSHQACLCTTKIFIHIALCIRIIRTYIFVSCSFLTLNAHCLYYSYVLVFNKWQFKMKTIYFYCLPWSGSLLQH